MLSRKNNGRSGHSLFGVLNIWTVRNLFIRSGLFYSCYCFAFGWLERIFCWGSLSYVYFIFLFLLLALIWKPVCFLDQNERLLMMLDGSLLSAEAIWMQSFGCWHLHFGICTLFEWWDGPNIINKFFFSLSTSPVFWKVKSEDGWILKELSRNNA